MKVVFLYGILVVALAAGLLYCGGNVIAESAMQEENKQAATYYFYWYRYPDLHFFDPDGSDALTDHPPERYLIPPPDYSYADVQWHCREIMDLLDAGIDIILPVYWGDYSNIFWSQIGLEKLVEAEIFLIDEGITPPQIGMFFDTTALQYENGGIPPDLTTLAGKSMFYQMIYDFFVRVPAALWGRLEGKPIIYLYTSSYVGDYDQSTFDYVLTEFANDFPDQEVPYIVRESSWSGVETDGVYTWGAAVTGPSFAANLAVLGPGYDDSAVYGRDPTYRDRECGEFYRDSWEQVVNSSAVFTVVETWNEYHEGTDVAESREYNRQYIELTDQYIEEWKSSDHSNRDYVWIDLGQYPYIEGVHAPNHGDGTWRTIFLHGRQAAFPDMNSTPDPSYHIYLNVDDAYILGHDDISTPVWITVEYFDGGSDSWFLQYDSVGPDDIEHVFKPTSTIQLQNSGLWKRVTFALSDAYFANRQQDGLADFRLVDGYDGVTNYFGRVWVFLGDFTSLHAPDITGLRNISIRAGMESDYLLTPSDPDHGVLTLNLNRAPGFISLIDHQDGTYSIHLEPELEDISYCAYRTRLIVVDDSNPKLMDVETISVHVFSSGIYLPIILRK